jgi:hypothetical protein
LHDALARIRALYAVERGAKERGLTGAALAAYRQQHAAPILTAFADWLAEQGPRVLPKSAIGEAFTYATNQWPSLVIYTRDERLTIDNGPTESSPLGVGTACTSPATTAHGHVAQPRRLDQEARNQPVGLPQTCSDRVAARPLGTDLTDLLPDVWCQSRAGPAAASD